MRLLFSFAAGTLFGMACILLGDPAGETQKEGAGAEFAAFELRPAAPQIPAAAETVSEPAAVMPAKLASAAPVPATPIVQEVTAIQPPAPPTPEDALQIPIAGLAPQQLHDTFSDSRSGGRVHDAIDIMAPEGTPVHAVADGTIVKLFTSVPGGLTVYQFDQREIFSYYYAHLSSYAGSLKAGDKVRQGDLIGYVGHTGNASAKAPHLHFAIARLGPEKRWWQGTAVNPYPLLTARQD